MTKRNKPATPEYRPTWENFNTSTFEFDFRGWTTQDIQKRMAELTPAMAAKTTFGQWAYMKREMAALRNESVNRQSRWQSWGFKGKHC